MRKIAIALALSTATLMAAPLAAEMPIAQPTHYSVATTLIGALRADPSAKTAIDRQFPGLLDSKEMTDGLADRLTMSALQKYHPDIFTDTRLAAVEADLTKLPAK